MGLGVETEFHVDKTLDIRFVFSFKVKIKTKTVIDKILQTLWTFNQKYQ